MQKITNMEFRGIIKPGEDPKNRGRYKVFIPELMENIEDPEQAVIYCTNHVHKYRDSKNEETGAIEGQYFPLSSGTRVIVKFFAEDFQTGYIDRIISDYYEDSLPLELETKDRDNYYQLFRTVLNDLVAVTQETDTIPKNGIHIYNQKDKNIIVLDSDGIHIYSKENYNLNIDKDINIQVGSNTHIIVQKDLLIQAINCNITTSGNTNITSGTTCNIKSSGLCNIDGSIINLNCKISQTANKPTPSHKTELIPLG